MHLKLGTFIREKHSKLYVSRQDDGALYISLGHIAAVLFVCFYSAAFHCIHLQIKCKDGGGVVPVRSFKKLACQFIYTHFHTI